MLSGHARPRVIVWGCSQAVAHLSPGGGVSIPTSHLGKLRPAEVETNLRSPGGLTPEHRCLGELLSGFVPCGSRRACSQNLGGPSVWEQPWTPRPGSHPLGEAALGHRRQAAVTARAWRPHVLVLRCWVAGGGSHFSRPSSCHGPDKAAGLLGCWESVTAMERVCSLALGTGGCVPRASLRGRT